MPKTGRLTGPTKADGTQVQAIEQIAAGVDLDIAGTTADLTIGGDLTVRGSISGAEYVGIPDPVPDYQFRVEDYGAAGDNSTNDRVAIQAAIDAAAAYGIAHEYYAEVVFEPKTYYIGSAAPTQTSGSTVSGGNFGQYAMLRLPAVEMTGRKLILVFRGAAVADTVMHWLAETPQRSGTVLRANPTGLSSQSINGVTVAPSMLGGPLFATGNMWTNLYAVIDGVSLLVPRNTGIVGFDFKEVANVRIVTAGAMVEATPGGAGGQANINTPPDNDLMMALRMPELGNNDLSYVDSFTEEGWYYGVSIGDHFHANRLALIYSVVGIFIAGSGTNEHGFSIDSLSIEACADIGIQVGQTGGFSIPCFIAAWHTETGNTDLEDNGGRLKGEIHFHANTAAQPTVVGGSGCVVINEKLAPGPYGSAPAVPATTVDTSTRIFRNAAVSIAAAGATITQVRVNGTAQGATTGTFLVPSGGTIGLTYTGGPPTWTWVLL